VRDDWPRNPASIADRGCALVRVEGVASATHNHAEAGFAGDWVVSRRRQHLDADVIIDGGVAFMTVSVFAVWEPIVAKVGSYADGTAYRTLSDPSPRLVGGARLID
jgi:hypothetical protein